MGQWGASQSCLWASPERIPHKSLQAFAARSSRAWKEVQELNVCRGNSPLSQVPDGQMQRAAAADAAASPQSAEDWSSLGPSAGPPPRRKRSVKFVEFKSNTASLYVGGRDGFVPRLSRTESKHTQYCQHLASRKEAAPLPQKEPPAISRDLWTQEAAKEPEEETLPQFLSPPGHPPPPPPSPLISESNGHPSP